jgi:hypothetical protein
MTKDNYKEIRLREVRMMAWIASAHFLNMQRVYAEAKKDYENAIEDLKIYEDD